MTIGVNDGNTKPQQRGKTIWRILPDSADTTETSLVNSNDGWYSGFCFSVVPQKVLQLSAASARSAELFFTLLRRCQKGGAVGPIEHA